MDNLPHNIYFKDSQSRFIRINRATAHGFGLSDPSEAVGKADADFFTDEHARQAMADEQAIMSSGQPLLNQEEKETWPDGHVTWASTTKLPLYDEERRIVGTFGISRDITEQKHASEELRKAKEAAEAASRAKSDFLANMSHEIRTPMNAIIGMTDLVLDMGITASQRDYLTMVRESGESLLSLINDILDFSKIEAGKLDLEYAALDLRESLGDTMKAMALRAHTKGLELACQISHQVPDHLMGDVGRLRQIVVNLVGNAIKFTEAGEVVLYVDLESQSDDEVVLQFTVRDTGIGIPEDKRGIIFDAFEQADTSTTRQHGGTGLGLAISSRLVQLMRGQIRVESEIGHGSSFHFTGRFGLARQGVQVVRAEPTIVQDTRVLVIDDNATNRRILEEMLCNWGMKPAVVEGGRDALNLLRKARESGQPFRLVLSDANMPEMDGFLLAAEIKRDTQLGNTIIMMLTSGDRPGNVARCEQLGIASYLLKPIKQSELFDAIVLALGVTASEAEGAERIADGPPSRLRPLHVLLAEDSLVNQKLAVGLLEKHGHAVVVANHGKEAVAAFESENFDLILMDVQMPEMDGFEATAAIRAKEKRAGTRIPIIAMTAHAMKGDRERCLEAGMDDYVAKPIRAKQLFERIESLLGTATHPKLQSVGRPPGDEAVDWSEALRAVDGDHELLKGVVSSFLEESPKLMAAIGQAVTESAATDLQKAAHKLKGAVRCFGECRPFLYACQLEKMGQETELEHAEEIFTALQREMARLIAILADYVREDNAADDSQSNEVRPTDNHDDRRLEKSGSVPPVENSRRSNWMPAGNAEPPEVGADLAISPPRTRPRATRNKLLTKKMQMLHPRRYLPSVVERQCYAAGEFDSASQFHKRDYGNDPLREWLYPRLFPWYRVDHRRER